MLVGCSADKILTDPSMACWSLIFWQVMMRSWMRSNQQLTAPFKRYQSMPQRLMCVRLGVSFGLMHQCVNSNASALVGISMHIGSWCMEELWQAVDVLVTQALMWVSLSPVSGELLPVSAAAGQSKVSNTSSLCFSLSDCRVSDMYFRRNCAVYDECKHG